MVKRRYVGRRVRVIVKWTRVDDLLVGHVTEMVNILNGNRVNGFDTLTLICQTAQLLLVF